MSDNPAIAMAAAAAAMMVLMAARLASANIPPSQWSPPATTGGYSTSVWIDGSATFYGDASGLGADFGGACGFSANDIASLYSTATAALSTPLFADGDGCGRCYELRCVKSPWCNPGSPSITVTGTNLCPPNWYLPNDDGGWCNPPRQHFDLAPPSFLRLAARVAGIVPVQFRRVPCQRTGGVRFYVTGNPYWLLLHIMNVGGAGDVCQVAVRMVGGNGGWITTSKNWGSTFQAFSALDKSKGLAVKLTTCGDPQQSIVVGDAIPSWWSTGLTYQGSNNFW